MKDCSLNVILAVYLRFVLIWPMKLFILASPNFLVCTYQQMEKNILLSCSNMYFLYLQVISNLYRLYQNMDKEFLDPVMKALDVFEREIVSRSKPFFGGMCYKY